MKRFTATEKWDDVWFRKLKPEHKVFWEFIRDRCDNAGVWKVDLESAEFFTGCAIEPEAILAAFSGRIRDIGRGRWWIPGFVTFQCCGPLSEKSVPHQKIAAKLKEHGLFSSYQEYVSSRNQSTPCSTLENTPLPTPPTRADSALKEEEEDKEEDKEEEREGGVGGNPRPQGNPNPPDAPVEFPPNFPKTEDDAVASFPVGAGITDAFVRLCWNEAASRGGRDMGGQAILFFAGYVKRRFEGDRSRKAERASSPRGTNSMEIRNVMQAKQTLADDIRRQFCSETASGSTWADKGKRSEYFKLKREIKELTVRMANIL